MSESLAGPLITAMLATGNIRNFQIIVGGLNLLNIPFSYIALKLGAIPEAIIIVAIFISICCEIARIALLKRMIKMPAKDFLKKVYFNVIIVSLVSCLLPAYLHSQLAENFISFLLISITAIISTFTCILFIGCNKEERTFILSKVKLLFQNIKKIFSHL